MLPGRFFKQEERSKIALLSRFDSSQSLGAGASVQSFLSPEWLGGTASLDLTGSATFTFVMEPTALESIRQWTSQAF